MTRGENGKQATGRRKLRGLKRRKKCATEGKGPTEQGAGRGSRSEGAGALPVQKRDWARRREENGR